jgi:hypothetical protein
MVDKKNESNDFEATITFLEKTKKGEYTPIDKSSFPYVRVQYERINLEDEGNYVYSTS